MGKAEMASWLHILNTIGNLSLLGHGITSVALNVLILILLIYLLSFPVLYAMNLSRLLRQERVLLELTPPGFTDIKLDAFEKLFIGAYSLNSLPSLRDKLLRRKTALTFEVVSTKANGLRFVIGVPQGQLDNTLKLIKAALPETGVKIVKDYLPEFGSQPASKAVEFKLKGAYYTSLKTLNDTSLAYQAGLLELYKREGVDLQLAILPLPSRFNKKAIKRLEAKRTKKPGWLLKLSYVLLGLLKLALGRKKAKVPNIDNDNKLVSRLFIASMRLMVSGENKQQVEARVKILRAGLSSLSNPGRQSIKPRILPEVFVAFCIKYRLPGVLKPSLVLSTAELASVYHFPGLKDAGREDLSRNLSRTLLVGLSSKNTKADVILGENYYNYSPTPIGLNRDERARHVYIVGGTGNGKTTMLEYMANQDINGGKGVMVVDPHGDLAESLLARIPKSRIRDVVYFNPSDTNYPIGLNLLELSKGLSKAELVLEKDRVTESVISIFRKTFDSSSGSSAYRIERLLRNAIHTAFTVDKPTLFTVSRILSDKYYRWEVIQNLSDASLKRFWLEEFNKAGDYQRVKMSLGPLTRLERFERNVHVKNIIGQTKSGLNFDDLISSNKILICNLSKGAISEDASSLLGSLLIAKLQLSALRRQAIAGLKRTPFYVYVDEFQNYANPAFVALFSEARKYGINLVMAQQSPSQLTDKATLEVILDNIGSLIAFRSKSPASESLILPQFMQYIGKYEMSNLPRYHFYAKIASTVPREPLSGRTILLKSPKVDVTNLVIKSSRQLYAGSVGLKTEASSKLTNR